MLSRLYTIWRKLRTGLWFVPTVMALAAVGLAILALNLDAELSSSDLQQRWWLHTGDAEDARNLLTVVFSSMITMTTLAISITMVVLTLAASQLGPRIVRNFMSDLRTQFIFGLFLMTIIYCLLVLRIIDGQLSDASVPHIAVTVGTALALLNLFALLFFIHNLARSIVSDTVVRRVDRDLRSTISRILCDKKDGAASDERKAAADALPADFDDASGPLWVSGEGYVQAVEYEQLAKVASRHGAILRLNFRAGHFLIRGTGRIDVYPAGVIDPEFAYEVECEIQLGDDRTATQDVEYSIRHLVEIALRALSPGINDPFTAIAVIDRLGGALNELMLRAPEPAVYRDEGGAVRVLGRNSTFRGFVDAAFNQIRQAGSSHPAVIIQMLTTIGNLGSRAELPEHREALLHHASVIAAAGSSQLSDQSDLDDIQQRYLLAERNLR